MKITVATCTNRPHYWPRFCENLAKSAVELEVIFIGPVSKSDAPKLPVPVKYITTNAKPALAWEMGARAATGELLCLSGDDFVYSDGFFNDTERVARASRTRFDMFTARYVHNNKEQIAGQMYLGHNSMPLMPVAGIMYTEDHHALGGLDRRFHATLWDTDLFCRAYAAGGRTTLMCGHTVHEIGHDSTMFVRFSGQDKAVLEPLWAYNPTDILRRNSPLEPYSIDEAGPILFRK